VKLESLYFFNGLRGEKEEKKKTEVRGKEGRRKPGR